MAVERITYAVSARSDTEFKKRRGALCDYKFNIQELDEYKNPLLAMSQRGGGARAAQTALFILCQIFLSILIHL